jgi:hypothetical protein
MPSALKLSLFIKLKKTKTKMNTTTTSSSTTSTTFFNVLTLSIPVFNKNKPGFKSAITSNIYLEELIISDKFLDRMLSLNLRKMVVVFVSEVYGYSDSFDIKEMKDKLGITSLKIVFVNTKQFFSYSGFEYFFEYNKEDNYEVVYAFRDINWQQICTYFASTGIDISGGSNSKKHLLSPHQYRLSQFLLCLYGTETSSLVSNSFHKSRTIKDNKSMDYSTKRSQDSIIDFAKSHKYLKSRLLGNEPLIPKSIKDHFKIESNFSDKNITSENSSETDQTLTSKEKSGNESLKKELLNNLQKHKLSDSINLVTQINIFNQNKDNKGSERGSRKLHTLAYKFNSNNQLSIAPSAMYATHATKTTQSTYVSHTMCASCATRSIVSTVNKEKKKRIKLEYLESVKQIISDAATGSELKRYEAQLKLEDTWIQLIENKLNNKKFLINKYQNMLLYNIHSAKVTLDTMSENNYLNKKFPKLKNELNKIDFLILTFSLCISLYSWSSYNAIAIKIGKDILYLNYKIKYYNNKEHTSIISFDNYKKLLNIDTTFFVKLGDFFMSILQQFPHDIFIRKIKVASYYNNEPYSLEINKEYLKDIKENLIINPNTLPMLCKPIEWSKNNYGGYILNKNKGEDIITKDNEYAHKVENKESIYKAVNYLNSIKFGINTKLLNYLLSAEGSYILENIKPEDELQRTITLQVAKIYKNTYFYLNTYTDWRGRVYTQSFYISYQS